MTIKDILLFSRSFQEVWEPCVDLPDVKLTKVFHWDVWWHCCNVHVNKAISAYYETQTNTNSTKFSTIL